ncbi:MAG: hypothetical protein LUD74_04245, partial [Tannerellaceae bacterium]|nr:hypothetical protein [Tannerellaceae bacterium]
TYCKARGLYLGTGNPNAQILLVERECMYNYNKPARELGKEEMIKAEKKIIKQNLSGWKMSMKNNLSPEGVGNWFMEKKVPYSPLFPYKGQKNVPLKKIFPEATDEGTNSVWYCYQKLTDHLFYGGEKSEQVNFHAHVFLTKLSQLPCAHYYDLLPKERKASVRKRLRMFMNKPFFRQFRVVIMATGHYPEGMVGPIEEAFQVDLERQEIMVGRDSITISYNAGLDQYFIHTRQFGINSSDGLVKEIVRQIKSFTS